MAVRKDKRLVVLMDILMGMNLDPRKASPSENLKVATMEAYLVFQMELKMVHMTVSNLVSLMETW